MNLISLVFSLLGTFFTVYSVLCCIRIVLTWIPGMSNGFTRFLDTLCDPYLNFFSRRGLFRFGMMDFSPMFAIGILSVLSLICKSIASKGSISLAQILSLLIEMTWNVCSSVLIFFVVILIIRLIVLATQNNSYSNGSGFWRQFDYALNPVIYRIANSFTFSKNKVLPYKTALIIAAVALVLLNIAGGFLINYLCKLIALIPF